MEYLVKRAPLLSTIELFDSEFRIAELTYSMYHYFIYIYLFSFLQFIRSAVLQMKTLCNLRCAIICAFGVRCYFYNNKSSRSYICCNVNCLSTLFIHIRLKMAITVAGPEPLIQARNCSSEPSMLLIHKRKIINQKVSSFKCNSKSCASHRRI